MMRATARLDVHASQRVFRTLLDTLARPGTIGQLGHDVPGFPLPFALLVGFALADVDVGIGVLARPGEPDWAGLVADATGATPRPIEDADLVVALRPPLPDEIRSLRRGRADAPENGARLVLACTRLAAEAKATVVLGLRGPGVDGAARLGVDGVPVEIAETLVEVNRGFPAGIDTHLVAGDGAVAGLPRSTRIVIEQGAGAWATRR